MGDHADAAGARWDAAREVRGGAGGGGGGGGGVRPGACHAPERAHTHAPPPSPHHHTPPHACAQFMGELQGDSMDEVAQQMLALMGMGRR